MIYTHEPNITESTLTYQTAAEKTCRIESTLKKLGKMKDDMNSLMMAEFSALNPQFFSVNHQTLNEFNEVKIGSLKTLKGVSKVVVNTEITHTCYVYGLNTNK